MTFQTAFTQSLPTLALIALGASETQIGLQNAAVQACLLLQLPALRLVAWIPKRRILIGGQLLALAAAAPLLGFTSLSAAPEDQRADAALLCFVGAAAGLAISNTVWFPLLRSYVESSTIGRFFGALRSLWHLTLIFYFLLSRHWLALHPGSFGPVFATAWLLGALRVAWIAGLPERNELEHAPAQNRELLALARDPAMRRYLLGVATASGARMAVLPFALVLLRREIGFSDAQIVQTSIATYAGGLVSLYFWGRATDRVGAAPIFVGTSLGMALLTLALCGIERADTATLAFAIAFYFLHAVLSAGFGVADTHAIFGLSPAHAPSRSLVLAAVTVGGFAGLFPALIGSGLDVALAASDERLSIYRAVFVLLALLQGAAAWPLRRLGARAGAAGTRGD